MSDLRAILIGETEKARKFIVSGRGEIWIPRSVIKRITMFAPDLKGHREVVMDVEDWWLDRERL